MTRAVESSAPTGRVASDARPTATGRGDRSGWRAAVWPISPRVTPVAVGGLAGIGFAIVAGALTAAWTPAPVRAGLARPPQSLGVSGPSGLCARFDGRSALRLPRLPIAAPMTIECWVRADTVLRKQSVFGNTERGGVELIWSSEWHTLPLVWLCTSPTYEANRSGWTRIAASEMRQPHEWTHVAVVVEEARVRIFLDGRIVAEAGLAGAPVASIAAFAVGADIDGEGGTVTDHFAGCIDAFRVSHVARYHEPFRPLTAPAVDPFTLFALDFDDPSDPWRDSGPHGVRAEIVGRPEVVSAR